jgi:hypothetical protein
MIRKDNKRAPLAARIAKPMVTSRSPRSSRTRAAAGHRPARAGVTPKPKRSSAAASATIVSSTTVPTLDCESEKARGATSRTASRGVPRAAVRLTVARSRRTRAAAVLATRRASRVDLSLGRCVAPAGRLGVRTTTGGAGSGAGGCAGGGWGDTRVCGAGSGLGCGCGCGLGSGRSPAVADAPPVRQQASVRAVRNLPPGVRSGRRCAIVYIFSPALADAKPNSTGCGHPRRLGQR